jgi:hypothetical protein
MFVCWLDYLFGVFQVFFFNVLLDSSDYKNAVSKGEFRSCNSWEYDKSFWRRTIIQEWDLVCDRKPLRKLTQQVTFFGLLCGAFISGILSDK